MSGHNDYPEPVRGLPARLPPGEHILWQGSPDWRSLARRAFHTHLVAAYFLALAAWNALTGAAKGEPAATLLAGIAPVLGLGLAAVATLGLLAWLCARSSVYTLTNRRLVLQVGIALPKCVNVPYAVVETAALKPHTDGSGDIALTVKPPARVAYAPLWPHVRPWRLARPQPALRCVPEARAVASVLSHALLEVHGGGVAVAPRQAGPRAPAGGVLGAQVGAAG